MRKINVLAPSIYNRIAAGEVVDRPYSVVKELVENSLDAQATEIEISVECGGKRLIEISDNGSGIDREDLPSAFAPHATSKISCVDDLDYIRTLGFRGEALASIAAVSQVEIISKTADGGAYGICCNGGEIGEVKPAAYGNGTRISVKNLFYNTPVRAKFLKADKKEETDITGFVQRFILGNPTVSFRYFVDGKLVLQSFGGGLDEAVAQVYGAKTLTQCFKIEAMKDGFGISGYIGSQNFFKANKSYQTTFLNGRYIVNNTVATAVNTAYASYMMKRQFPFYVLNLEVPVDFVDVNVHPNKADVRFIDNKRVFSAVYSVISPILDGSARAADFVVSEKRLPEIKSSVENERAGNGVYSEERAEESFVSLKDVRAESALTDYEKPTPESVINVKKEDKNRSFDPIFDLNVTQYMDASPKSVMTVTDDTQLPTPENFDAWERIENQKKLEERVQKKIDFRVCKYRGCFFETYLLYEMEDSVYVIDQHAAHERLIYDVLCNKMNSRQINRQPMLVPYIFTVNAEETDFLNDNIKILRSMGFGISQFGAQSFRVDEVPVDLQSVNVEYFFNEILSRIDSLKKITATDVLKDKIATCACKHAVKGGMELTQQEKDTLFKMLDGDMGLKCPHGRPICVKLTRREIEKMFKRIV